MADGCVPVVLSPEPFSRAPAYLTQPAGRTVRAALVDAVAGGQLSADDLGRTVVYVDGLRLERAETLDHVLAEGQVVNIVVEAEGGGGGGRKEIGQILMTIAVIAVSMWVGGPAGATALGSQLLARVAAAAILTLGQAATAALFAPDAEAKVKTNERYALQAASNQYRPWAPFPLALGEVVCAPDFATKTYTQAQGDDVWIYGVLGVHYGPCAVSDLKIGDTLVSSMGANDVRIAQHLTPGPRTFTIVANDVDQLDLQEQLEATTGSATPVVRAASSEGQRFDFDFFLPGGLHFQKDDGRLLSASVTVTIRYRPIDEDGNPTGGGAWVSGTSFTLSSTTKEPWRVTRSLTLALGRYEFEVKRSPKPDGNEKRRDEIGLTAIKAIAFRKPVTDETLSIIEFAVRATALNQGTLAPITCRVTPICETWSGTAWGAPAPTSNPAAVTRWLMTGPASARPLQPVQADARLRAWYELCVEYDWKVGIYLTDDRRQSDVLALLEQAGRASMFWDGTQLAASVWVEKPAPRQMFTGSNLRDHRWTIVYPEPVHALRVEFQNIDEGGEPDELFVYADGYADTAGPGVQAASLIEALRLEGQKTAERAYRDGRWELGARKHRRRIDTWTVDVENLVSEYGDRVRLAWQRVEGGTSSRVRCRRWSGGLVSGVRLAHPVEMSPGESYAVDIRLPSGVILAVPVINEADDAPLATRELQFASPRAEAVSPKRGDLLAFGVPGRISEDVEILGRDPGEGLTANMTGVRYVAPLLIEGETGPIPELQTRLSRARQANPPAPRLLGVQPDPAGVRVSFDFPPWTGSPIVGFSVRWRPTPPPGGDGAWQVLPPLDANARVALIPSPRAVPVAPGDDGRTEIDVEIRAITASGQTSAEPMTLDAVEIREDPFAPTNFTVTPAVRTAPGGSSHGVLVVTADALEAAVATDLIVEVRRYDPESGNPDAWESAGLTLPAANPVGDILGLRTGTAYGVRGGWRTGDGWPSGWTDEEIGVVPSGSNVSDDTANVDGLPAPELRARLISAEALIDANNAAVEDLEEVYGDTVSAAASALAADASADNAYLSEIAAAGSAGTAVTQAGIATTKATEAGISSAAAQVSRVAADTALRSTIDITKNPYFDQGLIGWSRADWGDTGWTVYPSRGGRSQVASATSGDFALKIVQEVGVTFDPARKYRVRGWYWTGEGGPGSQVYIGFVAQDASGADLAHSPGTYAYVASAGTTQPPGAGWVEYVSPVIVPQQLGIAYGYPPGTARIAALALANFNGGSTPWGLDSLYIEDVTESSAAGGSASAAATSASQALASEGAAGASASAASGSATTASTAASTALTYRNDASSSAGAAASSASSAGTSASNAAGSAATASGHASSASASALSASMFSQIAAGVNGGSLNREPGFDYWPDTHANGPPPYRTQGHWMTWALEAGSEITRVSDPSGGYAARIVGQAGGNAGLHLYTDPDTIAPNSWYVVEGEVYLAFGTFEGACLYSPIYNNDFSAYIGSAVGAPDLTLKSMSETSTGEVIGLGTPGNRYRFSRLVKSTNQSGRMILYAMSHWTGCGSVASTNNIFWEKASVRPATQAEIDQQRVFSQLGASVSTQAQAMLDLKTNYALARYAVSAVTDGGAAVLSLASSTYGTVAGLSADEIYFGANTFFDDATDTMRTTIGGNVRVVAYGAAFGIDGTLTSWEGPASTPFASMSRANAYFYTANVAPYAYSPSFSAGSPVIWASLSYSRAIGRANNAYASSDSVAKAPNAASGDFLLDITGFATSSGDGSLDPEANGEMQLFRVIGGVETQIGSTVSISTVGGEWTFDPSLLPTSVPNSTTSPVTWRIKIKGMGGSTAFSVGTARFTLKATWVP